MKSKTEQLWSVLTSGKTFVVTITLETLRFHEYFLSCDQKKRESVESKIELSCAHILFPGKGVVINHYLLALRG